MPTIGIKGSYVISIFSSLKNHHIGFQVVVALIYIPSIAYEGCFFITSLPAFVVQKHIKKFLSDLFRWIYFEKNIRYVNFKII
jgi:hypothetical protein